MGMQSASMLVSALVHLVSSRTFSFAESQGRPADLSLGRVAGRMAEYSKGRDTSHGKDEPLVGSSDATFALAAQKTKDSSS